MEDIAEQMRDPAMSESSYRHIADSLPDGVAIVDRTGIDGFPSGGRAGARVFSIANMPGGPALE